MKNKEFITSFKFAKISNIIYSGVFLEDQIEELEITDFNIVNKNNNFVYVRNKRFTLKENDIIFCKTEDIKSLFYILKKVQLKNIKLITHQSDLLVTDLYAELKPECISTWYSVNVDSSSKYLISIPIGLSNEHFKNLNIKDFDKVKNKKSTFLDTASKDIMMFVNFQKSTNFNEREGLYKYFKNDNWASIKDPVLRKDIYLEYLNNSLFTLCPHGNGIDTHRIWEALYSGSIPITKIHRTFDYLENIPVLFVDDYKEINKEHILKFVDQFNSDNYEYEKMFFKYWKNIIEMNKVDSRKSIELNTNHLVVNLLNLKNFINNKLNSYLKVAKYYLRKIKKVF